MAARGAPPIDRDAVLDVATDLLATYGVRRVSLSDLSTTAKVSRQSLYRWFGDRDGVVRAVLVRERDRFVDAALAAAADEPDLRQGLEAVIAETLRMAATHPLLNRLRVSDPEVLLPLLASADNVVTATVSALAVEFITNRVPDAEPARVSEAADVYTRLTLSYLLNPPTIPPARLATIAATVVVTVLHHEESPALS
jgi:AcrR family transcriptional regulator